MLWGPAGGRDDSPPLVFSLLQGFTFLYGFFTGASPLGRYHISSETSLNRLSVPVCEIVLLLSPNALLAQRGGRGAAAGRPAAGVSNPAPSNSDISDFNRAVALQATPDQIARFQQLRRSTQAARKQARDLIQTENTNRSDSSLYGGLSDAVEDAQNNNLQFVRSFSASQQSGLKSLTKKLSKANADVSKQSNAFTQELGRSKIDGRKISAAVRKLDKALTGFQSEQFEIGKKMGIQPSENSL
jgi:hypothetical protein